MSIRAARRLLWGALLLSVFLHLLGVRFVHWGVPTAQEEPESLKLTKIYKIRTSKLSSPRPPPLARKTVVRNAVHIPKTTSHGAHAAVAVGSHAAAHPIATPSSTPTVAHLPTPAVISGCVKANAPAAILSSPSQPDISAEARRASSAGVAQIHVTLDANGSVVDASVASSSGNAGLDQTALSLAKASTYSPAVSGCKKIASTYTYRVRFEPAMTSELR